MSIVQRLLTMIAGYRRPARRDFSDLTALALDRRPLLRSADFERMEASHLLLKHTVEDTRASASRALVSLQSELDCARRRSAVVADAVVDGLITVDYWGNVIDVNTAATVLLGKSEKALLSCNIRELGLAGRVDLPALIVSDADKYEAFLKAHSSETRTYEECKALHREFIRGECGESALRRLSFTKVTQARDLDIDAIVTLLNPDASSASACVYFIVLRDVTYQNEAEERIESLQQFKKSLLSALPNPVFYKDEQFRLVGYNQAFVDLLDLRGINLPGKTFDSLFSKYDSEVFKKIDLELKDFSTQDVRSFRLTLHTTTGQVKEVLLYCTALRLPDSTFSGVLGTMIDLTELTSVKNLQNTLLMSVPNPVYYLDDQLKHASCNEAYARILGLTLEDLLGKTLEEALPINESANAYVRNMLERLKSSDLELYSGISSAQEFELTVFNTLTAGSRDVLVYRTAMRESGKLAGILSIMTDITGIKTLNKFQDQLFEAVPNPVFFKNHQLAYSGCNKAFSEWFGLDQADLLGKSWDEIAVHASERFKGRSQGEFLEANMHLLRDTMSLVSSKDAELYAAGQSTLQVFEHSLLNLNTRQLRKVLFYRNGMFSPEGVFLGIAGSIIDVTDLQDAKRFKESLIKSFPLAAYQADTEGRILACNSKFAELVGLPLAQVEGHSLEADAVKTLTPFEDTLTLEGDTSIQEFIDPRDSSSKLVNYTTKLQCDGENCGVVSFYLNVSQSSASAQAQDAVK